MQQSTGYFVLGTVLGVFQAVFHLISLHLYGIGVIIICISQMRKLRLIKVDWDSKSGLSDAKILALRLAFLKRQASAHLLYGLGCLAGTIRATMERVAEISPEEGQPPTAICSANAEAMPSLAAPRQWLSPSGFQPNVGLLGASSAVGCPVGFPTLFSSPPSLHRHQTLPVV